MIPGTNVLTLLDIMLKFDVWEIAKLLHHLCTLEKHSQDICDKGFGSEEVGDEYIKLAVDPSVTMASILASKVELTSTYDRAKDGGPIRMSMAYNFTYQKLLNEVKVLRDAINADLEKRDFVFIPSDKARIMHDAVKNWSEVVAKWPELKEDVREAVYCYVLGRNTASVFHSMRVAERGLRRLARKLKVTLTHSGNNCSIEYADWEKIITEINNKIKGIRHSPAGLRKQTALEKYSDAADHCVYMKDIWRNNVSHTRKPYKDTEALNVLKRVEDFMESLRLNIRGIR